MNERIKLLAEQAVEETQLLMIMEYRNFESTLYKKFAELIVAECANYITEYHPHSRYEASFMKKHFGVEE